MSTQIQGRKTYGEIKQELLDAGFTEEWIQQNYPGGQIDMEMLKEMYDVMQQQRAGIPQMNYTNLTGFLDNYIQNNSGQQYDQLRTYLSNQGYDDAAIDNILKTAYGYNPNLLSNIAGSLFDGLPGGIPDPRGGIGLQAIQFLSGTFDKFLGPQGSIRNFKANQEAFKASKPERTRYEVEIDPYDPNEYIFDPYDAAEGKLSTKAQYEDRLNEFSRFNYNPETGKYDAYYSPRPLDEDIPGRTISQIREGLSDRELQAFEGLNIMPEGSSFDITDGATIYYEPGEDERSQQEIDAATINILERSNPKTSSDPSTIYFDPVYGRPNNSTPITSPPINPNEPIITIDRLGGPVYQKGGGLPMAQEGEETSVDDNPLLPLSDEKMRAYEAGEITLSELISDDRNIKDMPYYRDRYNFTDNIQTFYNQEPTIDPFKQTSIYTNLPSEYEVIYKVPMDLDPDDVDGGPPDIEDYRYMTDSTIDWDQYEKDRDAYWDKYDDAYEKLMASQDYKTLKVGAPEPFNPRIRYIDEAGHTPSQLDEFYDQDLYDQYKYIRRIYSDLGDLNDRDNVGDSGTILSDYLFNIPVAPGTSKDDLGVKSYMLTGDKDISINDFLTVNPRINEFSAEEKFFYPEYVNIPYSIDDIVSNPRYAAEYNLDVSNVLKDGRPYYTIIGLPESEGSFEDGSGVRSGKVAPVTVQIPRGGSKRLVASVPGSMDYQNNYDVFHNITMADLADPAEYSRRAGYNINEFNYPESHAHSPYSGGFFGGARQDRSDYTLSNFGVASNYGGVGDPSFGMKYLPEADQYDVTTTEATLKPEIRQQLDELEAGQQKEYERRMALRDASAFYNKLFNSIGNREQEVMPPGKSPHRRPQTEVVDREGNRLGAAGNTLYYYEDDEGNILYATDAGGWGSRKKEFGAAQDFLKNLDKANNTNLFTDEKGKLLTPKVISPMDNPRQYEEVFGKIYQFVDANIEEGSIQDPTLPLDQFVGPGIVRKDLISTQQNDTDVKKYGGSILPMAQFGLTDDFDLTGGAEEIDLTGGSMFDNEGIFETEVQQPSTFNPYTLDYNPYADPIITEGKKQFGDRFLNFLQSPTADLMGDIGSTAVGFARFMNPFLRDIQAKRQEEELERFGMADNITPLDFSEFPTKGIQSTRSNLLGPESARYTYLNYGRRGTEINDSREVEVDEETLLQLKKLGAEIEIL